MKKIISVLLALTISLLMAFSGFAAESTDGVSVFNEIAGKEFTLQTGAGTWSTVLTIDEDGSFTGKYIDAGIASDTVNMCDFSGKFTGPVKEDDYTYSMEMEYLNNDGPDEEYVDSIGRTVKPSVPFGIEGGTVFKLYMKGHAVSTLPTVIKDAMMIPSSVSVLECYGILNENKNLVFHTSIETVETVQSEPQIQPEPQTQAENTPVYSETAQNSSALTVFYVNPINDYINVRSMPAYNSALMGTVGFYEEMYFYGETATGYGSDGVLHYWYKITSQYGVTGWVRSDLVSTVPNTAYTVRSYYDAPISVFYVDPINSYINVRSQPVHNSALVGTVQIYEVMYFYGETATGYGSDGVLHYWYKIVSNSGITGWVRSDLVSTIATNYNVSYGYSSTPVMVLYVYPGNSYLNVRTQPSHYSGLSGTVQAYENMYFYGESATGTGSDGYTHLWYKIRTDRGVTGWVRSDLVGVLYGY